MDTPIIDHRGPEFARLAKRCLEGIKSIFKTANPVIIYTATGTGAWEAALVNTLSPGDRVLMVGADQFATLWKVMAEKLGLKPEFIATDWRIGADPKAVEARLREDKSHQIKAVCVLHNETSTGCLSPIAEIRKAIDASGHPALYLVDTISSLASTDYRHDEWGVDVTVGGAQKGLMLPPGMSFNAVGDKALAAAQTLEAAEVVLGLGRHAGGEQGGVLSLYAGNPDAARPRRVDRHAARGRARQRVFRHDRFAEATRRAVRAWGLEIMCREPKFYSPTVTAVMMPRGMTATRSAILRSMRSIFPTAPASAAMRRNISASATSAASTTVI